MRPLNRRLLLALCVFGAACSSGAKNERDESLEVVGTPPTPAEDPFFYVARPPVDAKAGMTGTIGDVDRPPKRGAGERAKTDPVPERESMLAAAARDEAEAKLVELRATNAQLRGELEDARAQLQAQLGTTPSVTRSELNQCHSCVKLCPMDGECADDAELVCGWGAGKDRKNAMLRAKTECDGALQSLRTSGAFSRVAGTCPAASCVQ